MERWGAEHYIAVVLLNLVAAHGMAAEWNKRLLDYYRMMVEAAEVGSEGNYSQNLGAVY